MKSYPNIFQRPDVYKLKVIVEMRKLGASNEEIILLKDEIIMNAIKDRKSPFDVALELMV